MDDYYGTPTGFTTYHTARGRDVSDYDDPGIIAGLLVASEWLDGAYRALPGWKVGLRDQVREWPRTGVVDRDGYAVSSLSVPTEIENATYEVALRQLQTPGSLNADYTPSKYTRVSIDGAISVQYNTAISASDLQVQLPILSAILDPLLGSCYESSSASGRTYRS